MGPCSFKGSKAEYDELYEIVCDYHYTCDSREFDKNGDEVKHDFITYREWLARRGRLRTGKTVW